MKRRYRIRPNSIADYMINIIPTALILAALITAAGIITTWDMGMF